MSGLTELLARCEAATGPDREIDLELGKALLDWHLYEHKAYQDYDTDWAEWRWPDNKQVFVFGAVTAFTASIDAALALVERKLPGAWYVMAKGRMSAKEPLFGCELLFNHDEQLSIADGPTQSLAILAALLRALIARTPATGGKP